MKNLLLSLAMVLVVIFTTNAQEVSSHELQPDTLTLNNSIKNNIENLSASTPKFKIHYQGEIWWGFSLQTEDFSASILNIHTVHGLKLNKYLSTGIGVGLDFYNSFLSAMMPVYIDVKGYLPINSRVTPFIALDLGYSIGLTEDLAGHGNLYISPTIGLKYKKFSYQIGYTGQRFSDEDTNFFVNMLQFKVAYTF